MTAVDLTWLFYTKRCEKISLVAAAEGPETIIGNSRQNLGNLELVSILVVVLRGLTLRLCERAFRDMTNLPDASRWRSRPAAPRNGTRFDKRARRR